MAALARKGLAVVFDLDGVLVDSWPVCRRAFEQACVEAGVPHPVPVDGFRGNLGRPIAQVLDLLGLPATIAARFRVLTSEHADKIAAFPGVMELLSGLARAGVRVGVLTGKDRGRTDVLLARTGLGRWVDAVVTPDNAPPKPDPRALWHVLALLEVGPGQAMYVGDAAVDLQTANAAGVAAVFARWGALPPWPADGFEFVADRPEEVLAAVARHPLLPT